MHSEIDLTASSQPWHKVIKIKNSNKKLFFLKKKSTD